MTASQNNQSGKWGKRFMWVVFIWGALTCVGVFISHRSSVQHLRHAQMMNRDAVEEYNQRAESDRRRLTTPSRRRLAETVSTNKSINDLTGKGDQDAAYFKPISAAEGGFDSERSVKRAASALARKINSDASIRRGVQGWDFNTISLAADKTHWKRRNNRSLTRRVARALEKTSQFRIVVDKTPPQSMRYIVRDREHPEYERVVECVSDDGVFKASVIVDSEMPGVPVIPTSSSRRCELSFRTDFTTDEDLSRDDALDYLGARVATRIWELALRSDSADFEDKDEFLMVLNRDYPRELLVGLGLRTMQPLTRTIAGAKAGESDTYYQTAVVWSGNRHQLWRIADAVSDSIRTRQRAPFVRLGLSLGICILSILTWLRVDWWLKGHYSLLSKLAFVILAVITVTAVWNYPIYV